ncbi:hypothetical protein GCM10027043_33210 [Ferruginibacter profundus]
MYGKCKIKIKGNKIWIYAPANLTGIKEGELYESGTLHKDRTGKWIITPHSLKEKTTPALTDDGPPLWIDLKKTFLDILDNSFPSALLYLCTSCNSTPSPAKKIPKNNWYK